MLAEMGKKVIMADFDPQCNLTGMVLGYQRIDSLDDFYKSIPANNIKDALSPAFESKPRSIVGADCCNIESRDNLFLLPGHIGVSEYETTLGIAQELGGSLLALKNLPGSLRFALDRTAEKYEADYVFVDMSPSLGPINQNLLMISDHFIVPLHPDYFSTMALSSLAKTLPRWKAWANTAYEIETLRNTDYPFPKPKATYIGAIIQKYRPRNGRASSAFQRWIDQLTNGLKDLLVPSMEKAGLLDIGVFSEKSGIQPWEPIMEVSDFNSLIAISQENQVPIYSITEDMARQQGAVWEQTVKNMKTFKDSFRECAEKIIKLTE